MNINPIAFFEYTGYLAALGWILLAISLFAKGMRATIWPLTQFIIPAVFCVCYLLMLWQGRAELHLASFFSHEGVSTLYVNDSALTAGWLHFLALDMFVGAWIARDGVAHGMSTLLILLCLPFTLMFAPFGLLLYLALRYMFGRGPAGADYRP